MFTGMYSSNLLSNNNLFSQEYLFINYVEVIKNNKKLNLTRNNTYNTYP